MVEQRNLLTHCHHSPKSTFTHIDTPLHRFIHIYTEVTHCHHSCQHVEDSPVQALSICHDVPQGIIILRVLDRQVQQGQQPGVCVIAGGGFDHRVVFTEQ